MTPKRGFLGHNNPLFSPNRLGTQTGTWIKSGMGAQSGARTLTVTLSTSGHDFPRGNVGTSAPLGEGGGPPAAASNPPPM